MRARERAEDLDRVKSEIGSALKPVVDRQEGFENQSNERFNDLEKRIDAMLVTITTKPDNDPSKSTNHDPSRLKDIEDQLAILIKHSKAPVTHQVPPLPSLDPGILSAGPVHGHSPPLQSQQTPFSETETASIKSIISHAQKIVGLGPVTPADIEGLGHDDPAKGLRLVALEILRMDLNIKEHEISADDIAATFTSVQFPNPPRVYVRFYKQEHANLCLSVVKRLRNSDVKVCRYFPRQFRERYRALENIAYPLRYPRSIPGFKTEVVYTEDDIELLVCPNGHFRYRAHPVHDLPPIDLEPVRSPPKGRRKKRGRSDTKSPELERKTGRFG